MLRLCQQAGLVSLGRIALDGSRIRANASKHRAISRERILKSEKHLKAEMRALLRKGEIIDAQEEGHYGQDKRGDELLKELPERSSRLEWLRNAKAGLEAEAGPAKAAQRQQEANAADQEAAAAEASGDDQTSKRTAPRRRGACKRADDARKLASEKAEAAGHEPFAITGGGLDDLYEHQRENIVLRPEKPSSQTPAKERQQK